MSFVHHTNIILGGKETDFNFKKFFIDKLKFDITKNPDFLLIKEETFGIDNARDFEKWVMGKPLVNDYKVCLLILDSITFEAQNALLKVIEEPRGDTFIFISISSIANILPTFLSRVVVTKIDTTNNKILSNTASKFLKSDINERLKLISLMLKSDDKNKKIKDLIINLENISYNDSSIKINKNYILKAKKFLTARGSSQRMIMEWLSSVL